MARRRTPVATRSAKADFRPEDRNALERLGRTIRATRALRGMTQRELAAKVGSSQNHISNVESGKREPGIILVVRISKALDVRVDLLVVQAMESGARKSKADQLADEARKLLLSALEGLQAQVNVHGSRSSSKR